MEGLFQPLHLLVILVIVLLIFGPKKLGDLGKGLGEGIRNFKSGLGSGNDSTTSTTTNSTATENPTAKVTPTEEKK